MDATLKRIYSYSFVRVICALTYLYHFMIALLLMFGFYVCCFFATQRCFFAAHDVPILRRIHSLVIRRGNACASLGAPLFDILSCFVSCFAFFSCAAYHDDTLNELVQSGDGDCFWHHLLFNDFIPLCLFLFFSPF